MARYLTQRGIPFFKQSIEESEKDVIEAKTGYKMRVLMIPSTLIAWQK